MSDVLISNNAMQFYEDDDFMYGRKVRKINSTRNTRKNMMSVNVNDYDGNNEYTRLRLGKNWKVSEINANYQLSECYPNLF